MTDRVFTDPTTGEVVDDPELRPFADLLASLGNGRMHRELTETLWDALRKVTETGKPATVTLTLTLKPLDKSEDAPIVVKDAIKANLPEFDRPESVYYVDHNGNLSTRNPRQPSLDEALVVPEAERVLRTVK